MEKIKISNGGNVSNQGARKYVSFQEVMDQPALWSVGRPSNSDADTFARAVSSSGEVHLICSERSSVLPSQVIWEWWESSEVALVVRLKQQSVAMATLTTREASLMEGTVELCHLFVVPEYRRQYNGSALSFRLLGTARQLNFNRIVARVIEGNSVGKQFLESLNWKRMTEAVSGDPSLVWYEKEVKQ